MDFSSVIYKQVKYFESRVVRNIVCKYLFIDGVQRTELGVESLIFCKGLILYDAGSTFSLSFSRLNLFEWDVVVCCLKNIKEWLRILWNINLLKFSQLGRRRRCKNFLYERTTTWTTTANLWKCFCKVCCRLRTVLAIWVFFC